MDELDMLVLNAASLKSKAAVDALSPEVKEQLPRLAASRLLPLHDVRLRAPTCAVVGTGGLLLMNRYPLLPPLLATCLFVVQMKVDFLANALTLSYGLRV
jgi:hypothetical protein